MTDIDHSSLAPTLVIIVAFAHYTLVAKQTLTATVAFVSGQISLIVSSWLLETSIAVFDGEVLLFLKAVNLS